MTVAAVLAALGLAVPAEAVAPVVIDIANVQIWQGIVAMLVALGLSPAPWILGLALGRIQFTGPAERSYSARVADNKDANAAAVAEIVKHHSDLVAEKDRAYAELKESRDYYRTARLAEQARGDKATDQLAEVVEVAKVSMQVLNAIDEAAKGAPNVSPR